MFKVIPRESSLRDDKVKMRLGFIVRLQHHERTLVTFNELVLNTTSAVSGMKFAQSRDLLLCLSWQKFCQVLGSVRMTLSRRMAEGSVPRSKISLSLGPVFFTNKQQNGGDDPGPQVNRHPSPGVREEELGEV